MPIRISYPGGPEVYSQTENISRLGTYVEIEREIPLGVHLDMTMEIPAYTNDSSLVGNIKCRGDVFRCNFIREAESKKFFGLGIFFTGFPDEQDRNKLSKYIDFLIFKEQEDIKQGLQRWRRKRRKRQS